MRVSLTQAVVDAELRCPDGRRKIEYSDSDGVKGLMIEVRAGSDDHTYYLRFRDAANVTRLTRIGRTSVLSLAEARKEAKARKARLTLGADLHSEAKAKKAVPLYSEFFEQRYLPYVFLRKRSAKRDRELYELRIKPAIGNLKLTQITRERIQAIPLLPRRGSLPRRRITMYG